METTKLILDIFKSIVLAIIAVLLFLIYLQLPSSKQSISLNKVPDVVEKAQKTGEQNIFSQRLVEEKKGQDPDAPANRTAIISDLTKLASLAHEYYRGSVTTAGRNSFEGWKIPPGRETTSNGNFTASITSNSITFIGTGNRIGYDGSTPVKIIMVIDGSRIISTNVDN